MIAIYLILDEAETPRYVGKTIRPLRRPLDHLRRHPEWAHSFRILEIVGEGSRWQDRERYWIAYYRRFAILENIARGGGSAGEKSAAAIEQFQQKMRGRGRSAETVSRIKQAIRNRTPEERAAIADKISAAKKGRAVNHTPEGRQRSLQALEQNRGSFAGRHHSAAALLKISENQRGRAPNSGSFQKGNYPQRWAK